MRGKEININVKTTAEDADPPSEAARRDGVGECQPEIHKEVISNRLIAIMVVPWEMI